MIKTCSVCQINKEISDYYLHKKSKDGFQSHCKGCHRIMSRRNYINNKSKDCEAFKKKCRETMKRWRKNNPEKVKLKNTKYRLEKGHIYKQNRKDVLLRKKKQIISMYGGKCECCGIDDYRFLTFDHIYNDGKKHRKENIYQHIIKNSYPKYLRLLCWNCNLARQIYGGVDKKCPHKLKTY